MGDGIDILKDTLKVLNGGSIDPDLVRSLTSNGSLSIELMGEILIKIQELVNSGGGGGVPTNLTLSNFRSGVVVPQIRNNTEATNNNIATELGIRNAIDQAILGTFKIQGNKDTEAEILALTGSEDYEAWICLEDGKLYYWLTNQWLSVKLVDINSFINNTNGIMVVSIMPSPTVNNKDYTYFYIGDTAGDFKTKTFYKCVEVLPSTTPKTYHYEEYVVASDVFIDTDDLASITNPTKQVIYRLRTITYKHNGDDVRNVIFYKALGAVVTNTGVSITLGDEIAYEDIVSEDITEWISFGYIKVGTYSDSDFVQYENDNGIFFDVKTTITEQIQYTLYHNPTEAETGYINISIEEPAIDNVELTENTTRQDIKLIGEADLIKDSEFVNPKPNGIDIVLNTGTSDNPNIINDDPAYQYANNKTSSNNYINTRLETIERKADAKTLTKFVDALPANPDINTEYYVETSTPNVYERYFVDSLGTVKEIGNTEMDVSTLATKVELNLKEDLSNKTTTLDDSSTNTQYPSAKAVVDLVNSSSAVKLYKHNIKWGNGANNYCYFSFISTHSTPYTDKVEMAKDMIALGISATSPVNCYNSYNQQGLLYIAYYTENGTMYYKLTYEASSYGASNWVYLMGDTVTPLYSIATATPSVTFTKLWEGTLKTANTTATLSQSINDFPIIIVKTNNTLASADQGQQNNVYIPSLTSLNTKICIPTTDGNTNSYYITYAFTNSTTLKIIAVSKSSVLGVYGVSFY